MLRYLATLTSMLAAGRDDHGRTARPYLLLIALIAIVMVIGALLGIRFYR